MALPTGFWWDRMINFGARMVPLVASVLAFLSWAYNAVEVMVVGTFNAIKNKILSLDTSFLQASDWGVLEGVQVMNSFAPISETIALYGALFVFKGVIYLVRWIKSFIPTVAN